MAVKVNIVLDDDVKTELEELVSSGLRSRVINRALRKELLQIKRERLAGELETLRMKTRPISTRRIVALLKRDRGR